MLGVLGIRHHTKASGHAINYDYHQHLISRSPFCFCLPRARILQGAAALALKGHRTTVKHTRLPLDRIRYVAACMLRALQVLHGCGYAHRDIKPGNILITAEGVPVLADTDTCQRVDAKGYGRGFIGTTTFMAPEVVSSSGRPGLPDGVYTRAVDTWSLGAALVGCVLYKGIGGYLTYSVGLPAWVPADLASLLDWMLAQDHRERPSLEEALEHPFFSCIDTAPAALARGWAAYQAA